MSITVIENDFIKLGTTPSYGARVVSLIDKASGRDWMTTGGQSLNTGEDAVYTSLEAVAWDECFPTVGKYDATRTPWRRVLRDHGDLWGRPWTVDATAADAVTLTYADPQFRFTRELRLAGPALIAGYRVTSLSTEPLPYLWALHALLAVDHGDRIELPGNRVDASFVALGGEHRQVPGGTLNWHGKNPVLPFALDDVQSRETDFAGKFLLGGAPGATARVGRPGQWLEIAWDKTIADVGIWLTYGGWPQRGGHQEIALEPSSSLANDVGQSIALGAPPLSPGETRTWQVTFTVKA